MLFSVQEFCCVGFLLHLAEPEVVCLFWFCLVLLSLSFFFLGCERIPGWGDYGCFHPGSSGLMARLLRWIEVLVFVRLGLEPISAWRQKKVGPGLHQVVCGRFLLTPTHGNMCR